MISNSVDIKPMVTSLLIAVFLIGSSGITDRPDHFDEADPIEWMDLEEAQKLSMETDTPIFVFVEAEWCIYCRQMEREVFPEDEVIRMMEEEYLPVSIDLDSREKMVFNGQEMTEREFARMMEVTTTPTIIFISPDGDEMGRQLGYNPTDRFLALLQFVKSEQFGEISFEDYLNLQKRN